MLINFSWKNQTGSNSGCIDCKIKRIASRLLRARFSDIEQAQFLMGENGYCVTQRCVNEFHQEFKGSGFRGSKVQHSGCWLLAAGRILAPVTCCQQPLTIEPLNAEPGTLNP